MAKFFEGQVGRLALAGLAVVGATTAASAPARASSVDYLQIGTAASPAPLGPVGDLIVIGVTPIGSYTLADTGTASATGDEAGRNFAYGYTFSLSASTPDLVGAGIWSNISNLTGDLYKDTQTTGGYTVGTTAITPTLNFSSPNPSIIPSALDYAGLSAGTYTLELSGALTHNKLLGSFVGALAAVPLPGALVMFGTAFAGLVALGARRRRNVVVGSAF